MKTVNIPVLAMYNNFCFPIFLLFAPIFHLYFPNPTIYLTIFFFPFQLFPQESIDHSPLGGNFHIASLFHLQVLPNLRSWNFSNVSIPHKSTVCEHFSFLFLSPAGDTFVASIKKTICFPPSALGFLERMQILPSIFWRNRVMIS